MDDLQRNSSAGEDGNTGLPEPAPTPTPVSPIMSDSTPPPIPAPAEQKPMMLETTPSSSFDLSGLSTPQPSPEKPATPEPMFAPSNEQPMAMGEAAATEVPAKSGSLKMALIIGAIVLVAGAVGAAIFFGKGGLPFKGSLVTNELKLAPIETSTQQTSTMETTVLTCGDNQELNRTNDKCVCAPGNFDISGDVVNPVAEIVSNPGNPLYRSQVPMATQDMTQQEPVCVNCEIIKTRIDGLNARLKEAADRTTKDDVQSQIDILNRIAEKNGCNPPPVTCDGTNESLDATGQCVCTTNYKRDTVTQKCGIDCDTVVSQIKDIQNSLSKSPETNARLLDLQNLATSNACNFVQTEEKPCDRYERLASDAFAQGNFDDYLSNTKLLLDNNCRQEYGPCEKTLLEATAVKRVIDSIEIPTAKQQYQGQFDVLKNAYYTDPKCDNVSQRCSEIDLSRQAGTQETMATEIDPTHLANADMPVTNLYTMALTPGSVFQDDDAYYQKNCIQPTQKTTLQTTLPQPTLTCTSDPSKGFVGKPVTWIATLQGIAETATNPFIYSWSGDTTGDTKAVKATYTTKGTKTAEVTAIRDGQEFRATCSNDISPAMEGSTTGGVGGATEPPSPPLPPAKQTPPTPTPAPVIASKSPLIAAGSQKKTPLPEALPLIEPGKVATESKAVTPGKVSSPAAPVTATSKVGAEKITPAPPIPVAGLHAAATEVPPKTTPPEITPTGPEVYIYLIGFLAAQLFFFRRKICRYVTQK